MSIVTPLLSKLPKGEDYIVGGGGKNHRQIARELNISRDMARNWRNRWELSERNALPFGCRILEQWSTINFNAEQAINCSPLPVKTHKLPDVPSVNGQRVSSRDEKTGHRREHLGATCVGRLR